MDFRRFLRVYFAINLVVTFITSLESEQVVLRAVVGLDALLPCGQGRVFLDGADAYIVWMKNNREFIYRYPEDGRSLSVQTFEQGFGLPCKKVSCQDPTTLSIKHVRRTDAGFYRCRVHYQASPAVDFVIELRIVDRPGAPKILNAEGMDLSGGVAQLSLGSSITLTCEVDDDQAGTLVWWERNGIEMARTEMSVYGLLQTTLPVTNITRAELDARYECFAQSADVTDPLSASVVIKMYLPPISVEIRLNNNPDFEVGHPRVVDCVVIGCVPPPAITWHLGNKMLRSNVHKELHDGNFTVSSLTLAPSLRDDKHELTCRAHNSHLPREVFEDKVVLNVGFRPTCLNDQEENIGFIAGQTEGVACIVEAYPEPKKFSWTFADTKTVYTFAKKVPGYQNRYSSILTWQPQEEERGDLLCHATNAVGEQKRPCVYTVNVGGPPKTPDCERVETMQDTIKINCKKNWDGGRPQILHLELHNYKGQTLANITDRFGSFALSQTKENNLTAVIYATNSRGRSDIEVITLTTEDNNIDANRTVKEEKDRQAVVLLLKITGGTIIVGSLLGIVARFISYKERRRVKNETNDEEDPTTAMHSDGSFHRQPDLTAQSQDDRSSSHVPIIHSSDNLYSLTPTLPIKAFRVLGQELRAPPVPTTVIPSKAAKILGQRTLSPVGEDERTTYFV